MPLSKLSKLISMSKHNVSDSPSKKHNIFKRLNESLLLYPDKFITVGGENHNVNFEHIVSLFESDLDEDFDMFDLLGFLSILTFKLKIPSFKQNSSQDSLTELKSSIVNGLIPILNIKYRERIHTLINHSLLTDIAKLFKVSDKQSGMCSFAATEMASIGLLIATKESKALDNDGILQDLKNCSFPDINLTMQDERYILNCLNKISSHLI